MPKNWLGRRPPFCAGLQNRLGHHGRRNIAATIVAIIVVELCGWLAMRQIGGLDGDVMGGMVIAAEISIGVSLLAAPTLLGHFGVPL